MLKPLRTFLLVVSLASSSPLAASAAAPIGGGYHPPHPAPLAPYAGSPNYAHTAQPFQWGWFGAERYAPVVHRHTGYYGHPIIWSNRRW